MRKITLENASMVITIDGQEYAFDNINGITITDPRENNLSISPQGGRGGLKYRSNLSQAITTDTVIRNAPVSFYPVLRDAFANQTDVDVLIIDTRSEEQYRLDDSIIRSNIAQGQIAEGEASFDTPLNFATPPATFEYIPANE